MEWRDSEDSWERSHSKLIQKTENYVGNAVIIGQKKRMYRLLKAVDILL